MPRTRANASAAAAKSNEPPISANIEKSSELEEQVDFDGDIEEEVEYEEVKEEEEEVVEEEEEADSDDGSYAQKGQDEEMETSEDEEDVKKRHAELLALPPYGSEVYLGGIPLDASEQDLKDFCESIGEVTEVRIIRGEDSSENKGYAFVTFRTKELASTAIKELNKKQLKGRRIKCSTSQAKHKLFIGNVPKNWTLEDMEKVVSRVGPGINSVDLLKDPHNSKRNRVCFYRVL